MSPSVVESPLLEIECRVVDAVLSLPAIHAGSATVGEIRRFLLDDHVHMALLVEEAELLAAIEAEDLGAGVPDEAPALSIGSLDGKTICGDAPLSVALELMQRGGRRRLAVTNEDGELVGLLCRKASGLGFCSEEDVRARKQALRRVCEPERRP